MKEHIEAALAALGLKPVFGGTAVSFFGWWISSAGAAWFGAAIAFFGLMANLWFNYKKDKREQEEHDARMRGLA